MRDINNVRELAMNLVEEFYKNQNANVLISISKRNYEELAVTKEKILEHIQKEMDKYVNEDGSEIAKEQQNEVLSYVTKELWGYGAIDDLIHDKDISDIRLNGHNSILVKKRGKRLEELAKFSTEDEYISFITRLLERNRVNLGTANAIQTFTDDTQKDFLLRITAVSGLLNDKGVPFVAIRKTPKDKPDFTDLERAGMFSNKPKNYEETYEKAYYCKNQKLNELFPKMVSSRGLIFTGKGASGKTTLMNAFLARIPEDEAVVILQENRELFDNNHPNILSVHVLVNGGDSKISYTLGDLTRAALLVDADRIVVGEVKEGSEALGLSKASMTGHKCWTSVHGESCEMGIDKMADYISQATGYSLEESMKQILGFEYVVHLNRYNIDEIMKINGFDINKKALLLEKVYTNGGAL